MYHIVFKSPRHEPRPAYQNVRQKLDSVHNQFELDTIRGSIKSRWALEPYGSLIIQQNVWHTFKKSEDKQIAYYQVPAEQPMNGHIITVEKPADVIWFRMNHEHVAKNGCKMTHIYRDLDETVIADFHRQISVVHDNMHKIAQACSNLSYSCSQFHGLLNNLYFRNEEQQPTLVKIHDTHTYMSNLHNELSTQRDKLRKKAANIWTSCEKYLSEHKTEIS